MACMIGYCEGGALNLEMSMEKRIQQILDSLIKTLFSLITLRPLARSLFSFKGALYTIIAIAAFRILDALLLALGGGSVFTLLSLPSDVANWLFTTINVFYYVAFISIAILLKRLLAAHRQDESERALTAALKQGLLTEHEFEQKRLLAQKARFTGALTALEASGILTTSSRQQLQGIVDESHKRWILKEALTQARQSGAIDEPLYEKRLGELGLK